MTARHIRLGLFLTGVAAVACGTSTPPRFYTLGPTTTGQPAATASYGVLIGPVSIPASVDRPQLVLQTAPNRIELEEFDRWAAPLGEMIARTVTGDVANLLGTPNVATAPFANFDAAYRVTIDVQRFESVPGDSVVIEAVWVVRRTDGGSVRQGHTLAREPATGAGFETLAAAHSRALSRLSSDIAAAIRAEAGSEPGEPTGAGS